MGELRAALAAIVEEAAPMTVRQVYYQAVTRGPIEKTEQQYKAIGRLLVLMRRAGQISYDDIADNTRWMRKPKTYGSVEDALTETARIYRRQIWADLDCRVEVWLEKEALAGVLVAVTDAWDVPLMVTRGYPSLSYLHAARAAIQNSGLETFIYYFGDRDPSGVDIARHVEKTLYEFANGVPVNFESVAVTEDQIKELGLPTRPTKKTDSGPVVGKADRWKSTPSTQRTCARWRATAFSSTSPRGTWTCCWLPSNRSVPRCACSGASSWRRTRNCEHHHRHQQHSPAIAGTACPGHVAGVLPLLRHEE
jgi:hypothetical protein